MLVMGVGANGAGVARICKSGFQMRVLGFSRTTRGDPHVDAYVDRSGLHGALAEADFVCLALPVTPETEGIMDADAIAAMKPTAYLINIARGALVHEVALLEALRSGQIAGAALDVLTEEPAPEDSPFWDLPDVVITPHISSITDRVGGDSLEYYRENIRRWRAAHGLSQQGGRLLIRAADSPIREVEMALFSQGRVCIPPRGLLSYCVDRR